MHRLAEKGLMLMKSTGLVLSETEILSMCTVTVWAYPKQNKNAKLILYTYSAFNVQEF